MLRIAVTSLFLLCSGLVRAQNPRDSIMPSPIFSVSYSINLPAGDMAARFGLTHSIGGGLGYKTKKNWYIGVEGHYLFGDEVKGFEQILKPLLTSSGIIIGRDGSPAVINVSQKGYTLSAHVGKLFTAKWLAPNPNSGIMLKLGGGFMCHWVGYDVRDNTVPLLFEEYEKGYDRMCGGAMIQEYIGYHFQSGRKLLNLYAGFEFTQGFLSSLRSFDYTSRAPIDQKRIDLMFGFRIGWMMPFYKRDQQQYFYE